jgi:hypothetical protein
VASPPVRRHREGGIACPSRLGRIGEAAGHKQMARRREPAQQSWVSGEQLPDSLDSALMVEWTALRKSPLAKCAPSGVRGLLVYCADYRCAHATRISADRWPDQVRLSDVEPLFVCEACGQRGADIRPD